MKDIYTSTKRLIPPKMRTMMKPMYMKWSLRHFKEPQSVTIPSYNFTIRLDPHNRAVDEYIFIHRNWETDIAHVIDHNLEPGNVFVDVGANIGYFSLLAAEKVGKEGQVIAFEPIPRVAKQCQGSALDNGFDHITVKQMAVGDTAGTMKLEIMPGNVGGSSLVKNIQSGQHEIVTVSTLDEELNHCERIDVIKIDVEGYEYETLLGAQEIIKRHAPTIILEFSPSVYARQARDNSRLILELLVSLGYTIQDLDYGYPCDDIDQYLALLGKQQTNLLLTLD